MSDHQSRRQPPRERRELSVLLLPPVLVLTILTGCGDGEASQLTESSTSVDSSASPGHPIDRLSVDGPCASVLSSSGSTWHESCVEASSEVFVVRSSFEGPGLIALLRFRPEAELARVTSSTHLESLNGWAYFESTDPEPQMTFVQPGVGSVECTFNPIDITCGEVELDDT